MQHNLPTHSAENSLHRILHWHYALHAILVQYIFQTLSVVTFQLKKYVSKADFASIIR